MKRWEVVVGRCTVLLFVSFRPLSVRNSQRFKFNSRADPLIVLTVTFDLCRELSSRTKVLIPAWRLIMSSRSDWIAVTTISELRRSVFQSWRAKEDNWSRGSVPNRTGNTYSCTDMYTHTRGRPIWGFFYSRCLEFRASRWPIFDADIFWADDQKFALCLRGKILN